MKLKRIEKILVPVALTREGEIAVDQAVKFHSVFGSRIIVMTIIPGRSRFARLLRGSDATESAIARAKGRLEEFLLNIFDGEIPDYISTDVRCGGLINNIIEASKEFASQLIIIKKSKRLIGKFAAFRRHNAEKLIGRAFCPILTINNDSTAENVNNIVIPVDISKKTDTKMRWDIFIAKAFKAKITIISVLDINIDKRRSLAYRKAIAMEEQLKNEGVSCEVLLITETKGKQADIFLKSAAQINPDMIMIMTGEKMMMFGEYIGPFAKDIIHHSVTPVINVVPRVGSLFDV